MGYGDEIMASGYARLAKQQFPKLQILIGNKEKLLVYDSIIYKNNPNITLIDQVNPKIKRMWIENFPNNRPYLKKITKDKIFWNMEYRAIKGDIFFDKLESIYANNIINESKKYWFQNNTKEYKAIIFIETTSNKTSSNPEIFRYKHLNKDWGIEKWNELIYQLSSEYLIIQSFHNDSYKHKNIFQFNSTFRKACSVLNLCDFYVGPEGGFGHASAALNIPSVIYFGGWISPKTTGYNFHKNIYLDVEDSPCGVYGYLCKHCEYCRNNISVEYMNEAIFLSLKKNNIINKVKN